MGPGPVHFVEGVYTTTREPVPENNDYDNGEKRTADNRKWEYEQSVMDNDLCLWTAPNLNLSRKFVPCQRLQFFIPVSPGEKKESKKKEKKVSEG